MNRHKKTLLLSLLTLLLWSLNTATFAQPGEKPGQQGDQAEERGQRHERVQEARQAFLSEQMELTTKEAADFFPLYDKFEAEIRQTRKQRFKQVKKVGEQALTEVEARNYLQAHLEAESDKIDILRRATAAYLKVIPATKLVKMEAAERAFRRELVKRFRNGPGPRMKGDRLRQH